ncbi:MAG TPA: Ig-like domain-containing protein [Gemmatimonadales bacterium]|nr:Ig-like domain-containing protein [Gemmatimonadales bacterium]
MHVRPLLAAVGVVLGGCGGDGGSGPSPTTVIAKTSGDAQDGTVGQALAKPIQGLVTESNAPLAGARVTWTTTLTEGTLTPSSGPTDANGLASTEWTLGPFKGLHTVTATVDGATTASVNFTATAAPDAPMALTKVTGDNQTGMVNTTLAHVQVRVEDQFQNAIAGVGVSWSVSGGAVSPEMDVSDPAGISSVLVTLGGTAGTVTITATADGLTSSPVTFNATAQPTPTEAAVHVGNNFFTSDRNNSTNPAVDTIAVGGVVTWTWRNTGPISHNVQSLGSPSFTSSAIKTGNGQTHTVTFSAPGTFQYECAVHGAQMTGRTVVR